MSDAIVADETVPEETVEAEATTTEETETEQSSEESTSEESESSESSPEPKKDAVQDRIDELTKKFRDAEREAAHWRDKANEQPAPKPEVNLDVKTLADFDYDEAKYQEHVTNQAKQAALKLVNDTHQHESAAVKQQQFSAKEAEYAEKNEDYYNVTRNPSAVLTKEMLDIAQESDNGPALLHHLGKHQTVALHLSSLSPLALAREMGILEAKLNTPIDTLVTKAPAPAPKLKGAKNEVDKDPMKMSDAEFTKWRRKRIAKR